MDMSDEELLNGSQTDDVIAPNSLPSPAMFSNNIIAKLGLRGRKTPEAETANTNNNNTRIYFIPYRYTHTRQPYTDGMSYCTIHVSYPN